MSTDTINIPALTAALGLWPNGIIEVDTEPDALVVRVLNAQEMSWKFGVGDERYGVSEYRFVRLMADEQ
jgi:hypothetical protein